MDDDLKEDGLDPDLHVEDGALDSKKKLPDEDAESVEDLIDDELDLDKEDLMDDVEEM